MDLVPSLAVLKVICVGDELRYSKATKLYEYFTVPPYGVRELHTETGYMLFRHSVQ